MDIPRITRANYPITIREIGPFDAECSSVGMVVRSPEGEILFLDRLKGVYGSKDSPDSQYDPGLGWACPAGHIEANEHPFDAGLRELREETGINNLKSASIVLELWASNPCRKASNHHWYILLIETYNDRAMIMEPTKHRMLTWIKPDDAPCLDLEPAWREILKLMRQKGMI